ncbi:MAG: hypothetical protein JWR60_3495 [Polaromonas sp.]|nr:hypothetical protein [Polaromonas sp.]
MAGEPGDWKCTSHNPAAGRIHDRAVNGLKELAQGYALGARSPDFDRALRRWLVPHAKRTALMRQLADAGLYPPAG